VLAGYHGRYVRVDAATGTSSSEALAPEVLRRFVGGVGLGTWILAVETEPGSDPLAEQSTLVFALGPLVGTPLTTSAKFALVAISPLTGRICDALSSSHFALAAKRAGVDAIVITGRRAEPSIVFIEGNTDGSLRVIWQPAAPLWGLPAQQAEEQIRARHGADWQVAAIGPAGERLIPFATISHDGRHAGRGGLGAILGSKRIKAVAVRGLARTPLADAPGTVALARRMSALSFGPATEKYRELGTVANLLTFNRLATLPTRNFQTGSFEDAERLAAEALGPARRIARNSCASCTIGCEHIYADGSSRGVRLEYESLFALGPLCGVSDPAVVLRAAQACDLAGIDTITTGATIAFLMECAENGWIRGRLEGSGRPLRFGDGEAVLEAIEALLNRRGAVGELLALGSRAAAERIGGDAPALAPHVKGLELPGYDPRSLHTMALGLAVGTRGADHNRSGAYEADFSSRSDRHHAGRGIRLEVEHILVGRTPGQEDHDDRLVRQAHACRPLGTEQLGHRQAAEGKPADPEKVTPGNPVAESTFALPRYGQHEVSPSPSQGHVIHWLNNILVSRCSTCKPLQQSKMDNACGICHLGELRLR
jgi:aldehyde:ferredoxin oxidoreductase